MGLFYREDLFEKWGIEPPATWAEFEQAAQAIRRGRSEGVHLHLPARQLRLVHRARLAGRRQVVRRPTATPGGRHRHAETRKVADVLGRAGPGRPGQDRAGLRRTAGTTTSRPARSSPGSARSGATPSWAATRRRPTGKWRVAPMPQWEAAKRVRRTGAARPPRSSRAPKYPKEALEFAHWLNTDPEQHRPADRGRLRLARGEGRVQGLGAGQAVVRSSAARSTTRCSRSPTRPSTRPGSGSRPRPTPTSTSTTPSAPPSPARALRRAIEAGAEADRSRTSRPRA